jgi:hypothetical protein
LPIIPISTGPVFPASLILIHFFESIKMGIHAS